MSRCKRFANDANSASARHRQASRLLPLAARRSWTVRTPPPVGSSRSRRRQPRALCQHRTCSSRSQLRAFAWPGVVERIATASGDRSRCGRPYARQYARASPRTRFQVLQPLSQRGTLRAARGESRCSFSKKKKPSPADQPASSTRMGRRKLRADSAADRAIFFADRGSVSPPRWFPIRLIQTMPRPDPR